MIQQAARIVIYLKKQLSSQKGGGSFSTESKSGLGYQANDAHKVNTGMTKIANILNADLMYSTIVSLLSVLSVPITTFSITVLLIRMWDVLTRLF